MATNLSDTEVMVLLVLVIATFIKVIYSIFVHFSKDIVKSNLGKGIYLFIKDTKTLYSSFIDFIFLIIGFYYILIRETKNKFFYILCCILIFKAVVHFFVTYKFYKIFNYYDEEKILKFKKIESFITNYLLLFLTAYILKSVFF
jgi:hypothetical protein